MDEEWKVSLDIMNRIHLQRMKPSMQLSWNVKNCEASADSVLKSE